MELVQHGADAVDLDFSSSFLVFYGLFSFMQIFRDTDWRRGPVGRACATILIYKQHGADGAKYFLCCCDLLSLARCLWLGVFSGSCLYLTAFVLFASGAGFRW